MIGCNQSVRIMPKFGCKLRRRQLDETLSKWRDLPELPHGYIREIRSALEMSTHQLAHRMGLNQSSIVEMEANEKAGKITLNSLHRAANALNCRLVYALIPNDSLEAQVQQQAKAQAEKLVNPIVRTMGLEQQSTDRREQEELIQEYAAEILRKGGRELWADSEYKA
jgi:predicted DNA-binding mobile mystery protein A